MRSFLIEDTLISVGENCLASDYCYTVINYSDWRTGLNYRSDTFYIDGIVGDMNSNNSILSPAAINVYKGKLFVGLNFGVEKGLGYKWNTDVLDVGSKEFLQLDLNVDTFNSRIKSIITNQSKNIVGVLWSFPVNPQCSIPNYKLFNCSSNDCIEFYEIINPKNCSLTSSNTEINDAFVSRDGEMLLLSVSAIRNGGQYNQSYLRRVHLSEGFKDQIRFDDNDSIMIDGLQVIEKRGGNYLGIWNDLFYKPYMHPIDSIRFATINDSCSLIMAEVDYETGKVLWRKNFRRYLQQQMSRGEGITKAETLHDFKVKQAISVPDGIVWAGTRTRYQRIKPTSIDMPFLFKTDFIGNPIWYRDYVVYPDDENDEGVILNSILQTPDGGIVMAGESINFGRKKVQRSILI
ncbi:MAG: hypothetical protein KDC92_14715, partial [Bacteroidetes bacterium]|nr:hypothetical protein [Bacteroidota bacterium]